MFGVLQFAYLPFSTLVVGPVEIVGWNDQCKVALEWEASTTASSDWVDQTPTPVTYEDQIAKSITTKRCRNAT